MSQRPTPGFENEPEDWWPSEIPEESAGESRELEGQPPGPGEGRGGRGEADGEAGGIPVDPAPFDEDEQQAPASGRGEPARGDDLLDALGAPQRRRTRQRRTVRKTDKAGRLRFDAKQRLLLLEAWLRSKLPAKDFGGLVGVSQHTLYKWKQRFEAEGPGGLEDRPKKTAGKSRLPDTMQRAILLMKESHPEWGQDRIHDMLVRTEGFAASAGAIGRVLSRRATSSRRRRRGGTRTRSVASSGRVRTRCGKRISSPSS